MLADLPSTHKSERASRLPRSSASRSCSQVRRMGRQTNGPRRQCCSVTGPDPDLIAGLVERHEPVWLGSKPSLRAQDGDRTDGESVTKPEDGQRSATVAAALSRETLGRLIDRALQRVSASHEPRTLGGKSLALLARCGLRSLKRFEPFCKRGPPGLRIGLQRLGKAQQRREFCAQVQLIFTPGRRPSHMFVQRAELPTQLSVLHRSPTWIVIVRRGRMAVQRLVNRRGLAPDRDPQAGDFAANLGLIGEAQS